MICFSFRGFIYTTGNPPVVFFLQTPQQLRKDGAVLALLFRQFFKHNAKLPIR